MTRDPEAASLAIAVATTSSVPQVSSLAVMPVVLTASLLAHVATYLVIAALPAPASGMDRFGEIELTIEEPPPPLPEVIEEPEPAPEPPPPEEPEIVPEPAAMIPPVRRERPEPPVAPPPPPMEVLAAEGPDAADASFSVPEGEPDGATNGVSGGTGDGPVTTARGPEGPPSPGRPGMSRRELRARLLAYIRTTLSSYVNERLSYPLAARRDNIEGVVMLRLRLGPDGSILSVRLSSTSGHDILDRAALARVNGLGSMPAPPRDIPWDESVELPLPVTYRMQ